MVLARQNDLAYAMGSSSVLLLWCGVARLEQWEMPVEVYECSCHATLFYCALCGMHTTKRQRSSGGGACNLWNDTYVFSWRDIRGVILIEKRHSFATKLSPKLWLWCKNCAIKTLTSPLSTDLNLEYVKPYLFPSWSIQLISILITVCPWPCSILVATQKTFVHSGKQQHTQ